MRYKIYDFDDRNNYADILACYHSIDYISRHIIIGKSLINGTLGLQSTNWFHL